MATRLKPSRINVDNTPQVGDGAAYKNDNDFHRSLGGGDMSYEDFERETLTGNVITISNISNNITPSSDFTVSAGTVKEGIEYILRVNVGNTPYTMTLGTGAVNPNGYKTTLKANTVNQFNFIATSSSQLELEGVNSAAISEINWGDIGGTLANQTDLKEYVDSHDTIVSASTPTGTHTEGELWYDTTNDVLKAYDGTDWNPTGKVYSAGDNISISNDTISANLTTKTFVLSSTSDTSKSDDILSFIVTKQGTPTILIGTDFYYLDHAVSGDRREYENIMELHFYSIKDFISSGTLYKKTLKLIMNYQRTWSTTTSDETITTIPTQQQSDWTESDNTKVEFIKNKPTLGTASSKDTGTSSGNVPMLDSNGKLDTSILPGVALTDTFTVTNKNDLTGLTTAEQGDIGIVTSESKTYVLSQAPYSTLANWKELLSPTDSVTSVNSKTGAVTLDADDIDDTNTTNKFVTATDKSTWSGKQDALSTQTAYTTKGTSTKVPTITTNTLGQVTAITETNISFPVTSVNGQTGAVTGLLTSETVVSGDSGTTYTIKKSTVAPSGAGSNTITLVVE